jgi:hypothetical protein
MTDVVIVVWKQMGSKGGEAYKLAPVDGIWPVLDRRSTHQFSELCPNRASDKVSLPSSHSSDLKSRQAAHISHLQDCPPHP